MSTPTSDGSRDRTIPPILIQIVGLVLVLAVLAAGVFAKGASAEILLGVLGAGTAFAMLGGAYEKARREMLRALSSLPAGEPDSPERKTPQSPPEP